MGNERPPLDDFVDGLPPRSHTQDPSTSKQAEAKARKRFMRGHAAVVLGILRRTMEPWTATELARWVAGTQGFSNHGHRCLYQVRRRLSDLRVAGLVERSGQRKGESLWYAVKETHSGS